MFDSDIAFAPETAVRTGVHCVRQTNVHRHANALEIVYVLRGELHIRVSCEEFSLRAGDYAVLNRGDPHVLSGSPDNVTALVHVDLAGCVDIDPYLARPGLRCRHFIEREFVYAKRWNTPCFHVEQ